MRRSRSLWSTLALLVVVCAALYTRYAVSPKTPFEVYEVHSNPEIPATATTSKAGWYRVEKVIDGDTVVLRMQGKGVTVRVIGLDTPEVVAPRRPVGCFGPEASARAHALLDTQTVRFEADASQHEFDTYHRTLGYLLLPDGTNFEERMIVEGYGREYTSKSPYKYQKEFNAAQTQAQAKRVGLWAACSNMLR